MYYNGKAIVDALHDLLEVVIVRRGAEALENTLFEYLEGVFTTNLDTINKYVDAEENQKVKEVLKTMSGLGESLENKGFDKGFSKGLDSGKLIQLIELVQSGDLTEERAAQKAGVTPEEFREKMQQDTQ